MLTKKEVRSLIGTLPSFRGDCPECGGRGTLSISQEMGELAWFCFKAHCSTRGRDTVRRTIEDITSALLFTKESYDVPFTVPEHFVGISDRPHVERYFKSVNVYDMYRNMQIMLMYDPKQDRAVFLIERDGRIVDGVGMVKCGILLPNRVKIG